MTLATNVFRNDYVGTGITGPYPITFKFFAAADIRVTVETTTGTESEKALITDYIVIGAGDSAGGNVTFTSVVPAGYNISIEARYVGTQVTDIRNEGGNLRTTIEDRFDRAARDTQVLKGLLDRSIKVRTSDALTVSTVLAQPSPGATLVWNANGTALINGNSEGFATDGFRGRVSVDLFTAGVNFTAGVTTTLTLSSDPGGISNTQVTFDGVVQHQSTYSMACEVVTFSSAIPTGVLAVEVRQVRFDVVNSVAHVVTVSNTTPTGGVNGDEWVQTGSLTFDVAGFTAPAVAQGGIFYRSAVDAVSALPAGTAGYVLKTQGVAANPAWTAAVQIEESSV